MHIYIGDSAVGKSSILMRLKKGLEAPFEENVESTIGGMCITMELLKCIEK